MITEAKPIAWKPPAPPKIRANTDFNTVKGHEYERLLYEYLTQMGEYTIRNQWFSYKSQYEDKTRQCQLDIMLFNRKAKHISIIEAKLIYGISLYSNGAFSRMNDICIPVVKKAFNFGAVGGIIYSIENCKNHILHDNLEAATEWSIKNRRVAFMLWKPEQANWALKLQGAFHEAKHKLRVTAVK
jgi:hypothetical protein